MTLDGKGRIYAVVARTGAVHVFEPDGRWIRVCEPAAGDIKGELSLPNLTVSDSGDVYLGVDRHGAHRYLHFSPEGKHVGIEDSKLDDICEERYSQPKTGRRWVLGYEKLFLVDGPGAVVRTITRRADRFWLEHPEKASVASDGSIAVVSSGKSIFDVEKGEIAVSLYSPQGDPIRTFILPPSIEWSFSRIAYDGKRVVVTGTKSIVVFEASGKVLGQFTPSGDPDAWWTPFLAAEDHQLLLFDGKNSLHRFELP